MATTYKKTLKGLDITLVTGDHIQAVDTVDEPIASQALAQFQAFETMSVKVSEGSIVYIPFHAVLVIEVQTQQSDDITRPDPYCAE